MPLSKDAILERNDAKVEKIFVPAWNDHVFIRTLRASEVDRWQQQLMDKRGQLDPAKLHNARARFAAMVLSDEAGERMFGDADHQKLGEKSSAALQTIWEAGQKLNKLTDDAEKELEKNSEATIDADWSTD